MKEYYEISEDRIDLFDERYYYIDGKLLPSVTFVLNSVLNPQLATWFKEVGMNANIILKDSQEIGSEFHRCVEQFLKSGEINFGDVNHPEPIRIWKRVVKFYDFYQKIRDQEIIGIEETVFSHEIGTAGTVDLITREENTLYIYDWKTGKAIHDTNRVQISVYSKILQSNPFIRGEEVEFENIVPIVVVFPEFPTTKQGYSESVVDEDRYYEEFLWVKQKFDRDHKEKLIKVLPIKLTKE